MKGTEGGPGAADEAASNVVRLPKRPRHSRDNDGQARRPWEPDPVYDPAPTRPVTRAELQAETASWSADAAERAAAALGDTGEPENNVIDLVASRRTRADGSRGVRPRVMPRRVEKKKSTGESDTKDWPAP